MALPTAAVAQDGQVVFNNACRTCHTMKPGDNRLGPTLAGIIGRKAGTADGYNNYSSAMTGSGVIWDEATLDKFIESPDIVIPGNNMKPFAGITSKEDRQKIVTFLKADGN
ncbi:MAG: cytochrome c family protein [Parvibaculaceae bacterium]